MSKHVRKQFMVLGIIGALVALGSAGPARATLTVIVAPGWDLFETVQPTSFAGVPWEGVPLGSFDFGGTIGVQNTGVTDTIVQRLDVAQVFVAPPPDTAAPIPIELVALQLQSTAPVDLGAGLDFHYITLAPSAPSAGEMTITFDDPLGGSFDSDLDVNLAVRFGALNGPIILQDVLQLSASNVPWTRFHPAGALLIEGVNHMLNRIDIGTDFWPMGPGAAGGPGGTFTETHPTGAQHSVRAAPEPGTLLLLGFGGLALWGRRAG